jgi:hypothetical protein
MKINRVLSDPKFCIVTLVFIAVVTLLVPAEQTLGSNLSLVILHGAWVWAGLIYFGLASIIAFLAILNRNPWLHLVSGSLAKTAMVFWLTYLPMSLLVMQMNWGGLFFDEPRWKIPFMFAVVGLLMQTGLALINRKDLTSIFNLVYGVSLWVSLAGSQTILHPESPISQSQSGSIPVFFAILLGLSLFFGIQVTLWWMNTGTNQELTRQ